MLRRGEEFSVIQSSSEVVNAYFDAFNQRSVSAIAATFAPGGSYADPNVPDGVSGEALEGLCSGFIQTFPDLLFTIEREIDAGLGVIVVQWRMRAHQRGNLGTLPPSGRFVDLRGTDLFTIEDGRIRSVRGNFDALDMLRQLGAAT